MQPDPLSTTSVETVTVLLAGLEITLTARRAGGSATVGASVEGTPPSASETQSCWVDPADEDPFLISAELEREAISASGPTALGALSLPFLAYLAPRLRGTNSTWFSSARLARAFRAGVIARRRLNGEVLDSTSEGIPFRNCIYICLRTAGNCTVGFWTANYAVYWARVRSNVANDFHPDSISHAFASRAEGEAYLRGARRIWPPQAA